MAKEHKEFLTGLNRLHVMHHAGQGELYGLCMMKELGRGYRVSPARFIPCCMSSRSPAACPPAQSSISGDKKGHEALNFAKDKVREVFGALIEAR